MLSFNPQNDRMARAGRSPGLTHLLKHTPPQNNPDKTPTLKISGCAGKLTISCSLFPFSSLVKTKKDFKLFLNIYKEKSLFILV